MHPVPFHNQEKVVAPPTGQHDRIAGLRVVHAQHEDGTPVMISCWELTDADLREIQKTRKIYHVAMGRVHLPIMLTTNPDDCGL